MKLGRLSIFLAVGLSGATFIRCTEMPNTLGIVYPHLIESRNDGGEKIIKVSESITLNLKKSSIVSKEFLLRTYQDDIMEHNYLDGEILEENLYHDSESFSSVIVLHENGLKVEGIVSSKFGIKPMSTEERSADGSIAHAFYELPRDKPNNKAAESNRPLTSVYAPFYPEPKRRPKRVSLELMILVDSYFRWQFDTKNAMLTYLMITINAVNLKYRSVSDPEVEILFRAVEVFNHQVESKFLVRNGSKYIRDRPTLFALQKYVIHNYQLYYTFDALYYITGLDMGYYYFTGFDTDVQGLAFIGGVCTIDKLGMGEDKAGTYSGVRVTAHELGHLLGCPHDQEQYRFFSSKNCSDSDGYIMTYWSNSSRSMKFSECCNRAISELARSPYGDCLETKNATRRINKQLDTTVLPGEVLTRDKVCQLAFPNVTDIQFVTDNGTARCRASCYSEERNITLRTMLPDHSPCNETSVERKQSRQTSGSTFMRDMVCVNGDCRTKSSNYPVQPVKVPRRK
ncbi:venom metalloproteinase antarease-like TtrivMP_A isoform X2 [Rhipicephalus sanguineus]|uniref:venom metalloproteinase antarease-like TtrivMP_A isoform X2 n=2 Tax=Rhipicephalus sanguineus TaxID=34632 RepID=UPI001893605B|nr:venom metalloproteinase antarease-like TtrivMP_A isoform X2 [Rhipicephalus sanguineus]